MITSITMHQNNKVGDSNLMPIHSPLVFMVDAVWSTTAPEFIYCDVKNEDSVLLQRFKCIPYADVNANTRRFIFIANGILQSYMDSFDDFNQTENTLTYVDGITKEFNLVFNDPDLNASDLELNIVACHGVRQYGENPNLDNQYNNDAEVIYTGKGQSCYVYFYNNSKSNVLSLGLSYEAKFIITDSSGFVQGADITINGQTEVSDSVGEATFELQDGTYTYVIDADGYQTVTNSFTVSGGNVQIEIELTALVSQLITINTDAPDGAYVGIADIGNDPFNAGEIIDSGTVSGGQVQFTLDVPKSYAVGISADGLCGGQLDTTKNLILSTGTNTLNLDTNTQVAVTFNVKDTFGNNVENVNIGKTASSFLDCEVAYLSTDVNGNATVNLYRYDSETGLEYTWQYACFKSGYNTFSSSFQINTDGTYQVNVVIQEQLTLQTITFNSDAGDGANVYIAEVGGNPFNPADVVASGVLSGGSVDIDLYVPKQYVVGIESLGLCTGKINTTATDVITTSGYTLNMETNTQVFVTWVVQDNAFNPIDNFSVGKTESTFLDCETSFLTSGASSEASLQMYRYDPETFADKIYDYTVFKAGYTSFSSSVTINQDNEIIVNVTLQP